MTILIIRRSQKLFVAQWQDDQPLAYSPSGALFRSELELCSEHFDTLHLVALLPGKEVNVGDTWKIANASVQALCHFEGLTEQTLVGKLERVEGGKAIVSVKGTAQGIELGALVKLTIDAVCDFDLEAKRLVKVTWKQKDDRDQGPVSHSPRPSSNRPAGFRTFPSTSSPSCGGSDSPGSRSAGSSSRIPGVS